MIELDTIYNEDCLTGMQRIPDGSVDCIICDLPYGTTQNKWDSVIPLDKLWEQYKRVTKPTAAIVLTASQPFTSKLIMSNLEMFKHEWIWVKNRGGNFANTVREPAKEHEEILVFSKGGWTYNKQMQKRAPGGAGRVKYGFNIVPDSDNYGKFTTPGNERGELRVPSSVQHFKTSCGKDHFHPTQKPVDLIAYLIRTYSNPGDTILDNTIGSGTTAVAALREKRHFIGFELNRDYYDIALRRIKLEQQQQTLF